MAWSQPLATPVLRRQVTNCLLAVRIGRASGTVQLRHPVDQPAIVLDLMQERQTVEFPLSDLPPHRSLRLEIRELSGFRIGARVRLDSKAVGVGKRATIDVADLPGAEIRLLMERLPSGSGLAVTVKSVFREKAGEFDLNLPTLEDAKYTALPAAEKVARDLQDDLDSLNRNRPTNITEVNTWERAVNALGPQLRVANNRVQALNNLIAECDARIKAAPKVKQVLQNLHEQATIRFAIGAESGDTDIVLAQAGDAASVVP
jgi:hypothetical protein